MLHPNLLLFTLFSQALLYFLSNVFKGFEDYIFLVWYDHWIAISSRFIPFYSSSSILMFRYILYCYDISYSYEYLHLDQEKEYNNKINLSLRFVERLDNKNLKRLETFCKIFSFNFICQLISWQNLDDIILVSDCSTRMKKLSHPLKFFACNHYNVQCQR